MQLYTYATQRPLGARARSLHMGTPAHVYTMPAARSATYARVGRYTTVHARAPYTWAHPPTCAPYTAVQLIISARALVVILHYASADTQRGGVRGSIRDAGKHVTAGIAAAACGNASPLSLVASGKRVVKTWKEPLRKDDFTDSQGVTHWFCGDKWFPPETALRVTKCGSFNRQIIVKTAEHVKTMQEKPPPWKSIL